MESSNLYELIESYHHKCGENCAYVSGIDINKQFISTRANLEETDTSSYYLVPPKHFACNLMHIGRDEQIPIAYNSSNNSIVVTSAYYVFRVKEDKKDYIVDEFLYMLFNNKEFDRLTWFYTDSSIRGNLNKQRFLDIQISIPTLDEQQKVVNTWKALREIKDQNEAIAAPLMQMCQSYIQELKHEYEPEEIGQYIEESEEKNEKELYDVTRVRGLATSKEMITTKANMDGVSLSSYKVVKPEQIAFVPDTSRRGDKMSLGYNETQDEYLVSSISSVINVKRRDKIIPCYLYLWFCRAEFDRYARFNSWGSARETFSYADMERVKIPLPPIEKQQAIVNIYNCAKEAQRIAEEADRMSREICPALIQHVIHNSN